MVEELGCSKEKREEVVVVEAPNAVGAGGFEVVCTLDLAHEGDVAREDEEGDGGESRGREEGEAIEAEEPDEEVEFVAGAVVDTGAVTEGVVEVGGDFGDGRRWYAEHSMP